MTHLLDRPAWSALTTRHAALAEGGRLAKRYPPSIAPFAATETDDEDSLRELAALASPADSLMLVMADRITPPAGFVTVNAAAVVQMIAERRLEPIADQRVEQLGEADAAAMFALATLTKPGPFSLRSQCLGDFWGVKVDGRLVAMAGERMKQPGYTELSGVACHPDFRGRGLGRLLSVYVAGLIFARGERPYLHAYATNTSAIGLYERIGFRIRTGMNAEIIRRTG
jgi:predicted GNAT family acetyltransferase